MTNPLDVWSEPEWVLDLRGADSIVGWLTWVVVEELENVLTAYTYDWPLPPNLSPEEQYLSRLTLWISGNPEFQVMLSIFVEAEQLKLLIESNTHPSIVGITPENMQIILKNIAIVSSLYDRFRKHVSLDISELDCYIASIHLSITEFFQEWLSSSSQDLVPQMISRFQSKTPPIVPLVQMNLNINTGESA
jgi:hypothetical protein